MSDKVYVFVRDSAGEKISHKELFEMISTNDDRLLYFLDTDDLMNYHKDEEDLEKEKIFILGVLETGTVLNNAKFVLDKKEEIKASKKK
jgi:hypothetical protein